MINNAYSNQYIKLSLLSFYILCWISISTTFQDILAIKEINQFEYDTIFNFFKTCIGLFLSSFWNINKSFFDKKT